MQENKGYGNNILGMILKQSDSAENDFFDEKIIYEYISSQEVGKKILQDFMKFYDNRAKSFPLDDGINKQKFGTITHIMALSTLLELQSLDVDLTEYEDIYYGLMEKVFNCIYRDNRPVFDASPYWDNKNYTIDTYVETASKLISTFVDLRDDLLIKIQKKKTKLPVVLHINGKDVSDANTLLECVEKLMIEAVNIINDAALPLSEPFEYIIDGKRVVRGNIASDVKFRGWAFQKPESGTESDYETSLYYTYYGTNAFISIYNSLETYYDYLDGGIGLYANLDKTKLNAVEKQRYFKYEKDAQFYANNKESLDRMRNIVASAGRYIETKLRENGANLAFDYIDRELMPVSLDNIARGKSNHIMNSLFVFAILINTGIDDDYSSIGKANIYQTIQFALTNIKKIYLEFKEARREDLIENFALGEDKCPREVSVIMQTWRKSGTISTYDLVPLYCNTYNLVSSYIIKYPQKEMRDNLVWLLENKSTKGWFWTKEGFSINNNLYYIYALDSFYAYYNKYEADFLNADGIKNDLAKKNRELLKVKEEKENEIQKIKEECKKQISEIENIRSPLDAEVEKLVVGILDASFSQYFEKTLTEYLNAGINFAIKVLNGSADARDELVEEFKMDNRVNLIFATSSLATEIASEQAKRIVDLETGIQKEKFSRMLIDKIFDKFYR